MFGRAKVFFTIAACTALAIPVAAQGPRADDVGIRRHLCGSIP
jgi:hypothetical protein